MKFSILSGIFLAACCFYTLHSADAKTLKVYLMTGQSNMDGTVGGNLAPTTDFDEISTTGGKATHEADQNVLMWNFLSPQNDTTSTPSTSNSSWESLHAYGNNGNDGNRWGPEIGMARTMYDAGARDFAIIKVAQSGMPNEAWVRHTDSSGNIIANPNQAFQNCYYDLYYSIVQALKNLPEGYDSVEFAGLGYLQGEGNGNTVPQVSSTAEAPGLAGECLSDLVNNLKEDLGKLSQDGVSVTTDGMKLVIGQIGENSQWGADQKANANTTDAEHKELASSRDDVAFVPGRGLPSGTPSGTGDVHYNADSEIILGERFGDAFLNLGTYEKAPTTLLEWKGGATGNWSTSSWGTTGTEAAWGSTTNIAAFSTPDATITVDTAVTASGLRFSENTSINSSSKLLTLAHQAEIHVADNVTGTLNAAVNLTYGMIKTGKGELVVNNASTNLLGMSIDIQEGTLTLQNATGFNSKPNIGYTEGLGRFNLHQGTTLQLRMGTTAAAGISAFIDVLGESTIQLNNSVNTIRNLTNSSSNVNKLHVVTGGAASQLYLSSDAANVVLQFDQASSGASMSAAASFLSGTYGGLNGGWNHTTNGNFRIDGDANSPFTKTLILDVAQGNVYTFENSIANLATGSRLVKKGEGTQILTGQYGYNGGGAIRSSVNMDIDIQKGILEVQSGINNDKGKMAINIERNGTFHWNTTQAMTSNTDIQGDGSFRVMKNASFQNNFSKLHGHIIIDDGVVATWSGAQTLTGKISGQGQSSVMVLSGGSSTTQNLGDASGVKQTFVDNIHIKAGHSVVVSNVSLGTNAVLEATDGPVALTGKISLHFESGAFTHFRTSGGGSFNLESNGVFVLSLAPEFLQTLSGSDYTLSLFDRGEVTFAEGFNSVSGIQIEDVPDYRIEVVKGDEDWTQTGNLTIRVSSASIPEPSTVSLGLVALSALMIKRRRKY